MTIVFEPLDTVMFTLTTSTAPDAAPNFSAYDALATLVTSFTAASSDSTHYYALYTMSAAPGEYVGQWAAAKTFSGSARSFVKRFIFNVVPTKPS